ncbi:MAG: 50S ribosomal protein L13 [Armatimonadota bacterium]
METKTEVKKKTKKTVKKETMQRSWYVMDAEGKSLGRLSTRIAGILTGKNKPVYARDIDRGDFVVVVNAGKIRITGRKQEDKKYYRHSGYPGGLKVISMKELLLKRPSRIIEHAVKGMLPKNKLRDKRMKRLKVYAGDSHPHKANNPEVLA